SFTLSRPLSIAYIRTSFFSLVPRPLSSTLFPYTTLFRSRPSTYAPTISTIQNRGYVVKEDRDGRSRSYSSIILADGAVKKTIKRSEEHTSELQSRENLVCRLLLEKKKNRAKTRKDTA